MQKSQRKSFEQANNTFVVIFIGNNQFRINIWINQWMIFVDSHWSLLLGNSFELHSTLRCVRALQSKRKLSTQYTKILINTIRRRSISDCIGICVCKHSNRFSLELEMIISLLMLSICWFWYDIKTICQFHWSAISQWQPVYCNFSYQIHIFLHTLIICYQLESWSSKSFTTMKSIIGQIDLIF